jgi:pilus assembly protein Flp/PilA
MIRFLNLCKRALRQEQGATAIEYGLIAALLVLGILISVRGAMTASVNMWTRVSTQLTAASN